MTGPIELLEERLDEIKKVKNAAKKVSEEDSIEIDHLWNEYYACITLLKNIRKVI